MSDSFHEFRLNPNGLKPPKVFPHEGTIPYFELCVSITTEVLDRKYAPNAEPEQFRGSHLASLRILQVVVRILQVIRDSYNPNPVSDLQPSPIERRAALASSPSFGLFSQSAHFFSSTSSYSASITPSSFLAWPLLPGAPSPAGPAPAPGVPPVGGVCAALYICSASLCEA
jgi:hypothetical protein